MKFPLVPGNDWQFCPPATRCWWGLAVWFVTSGVPFTSTANAGYTFTPLGHLAGGKDSQSVGVSDDGAVVAGTSGKSFGQAPFLWTSTGGMVEISGASVPLFDGSAQAISGDGNTVVGYGFDLQRRIKPFRYSSADGMVALGLPFGTSEGMALDASSDGSMIVGWASNAERREAVLWTSGGGAVGLGDLPGVIVHSEARGISADGSVIVGYGRSLLGYEAFRWTADQGMVPLGDLAGGNFDSHAADVSADGTTIVGTATSTAGTEAFRWTSEAGMVGLGDLPGGRFFSQATAVSGKGTTVVGWSSTSNLAQEAFLWTESLGMVNLKEHLVANGVANLDQWTLEKAIGISPDGRVIVGYGVNPVGRAEAWIVVVPEASTFSLAALGACALIFTIRDRRNKLTKYSL